ncbi:MAG TPA: DUF58 domain-containing protein [Thermomonas sp.]|uniref:DUF58 domain-containing protein n=1 Tax=Thermomonas sp. TaxID=1971895 RepID=UPI002CB60394|nr:DUF58 domain-containing protein [Thermomonas sp.]HOV95674.1 DUF58 domain-containing protein [Thermomonas sp.]
MRPSLLLPLLCVGWALLGVAASAAWLPALAWWATGGVLLSVALLDGWRLRRYALPEVLRELPDALPVGVAREVVLVLDNGPRALRVDVHDVHPSDWVASGLPRTLHLVAEASTRVSYTLRPTSRGDAHFDGVHLRLHSPWRLWRRACVVGAPQRVRVYPNFAPLAKLAMLGSEQASRTVGAHLRRRRGEGTDFHQMRDYRVGDSLRQIDWKATARVRRLISREYQDERNQQVVLLIDTGLRMLARDGELTHFDHVLDAALVVSYLALREGDAVGLLASGGERRWVAPQRGAGALDVLLRASYDVQPQPVATDYLAAATELSLRQRRRSLVMLVTNLRDEDIDDLLVAVRMLQQRHHVVVASLREEALDAVLDDDVQNLRAALRAAATARYLQQRSRTHDALRAQRVSVLDVTCAQLPGALVERYLAIKREGLL